METPSRASPRIQTPDIYLFATDRCRTMRFALSLYFFIRRMRFPTLNPVNVNARVPSSPSAVNYMPTAFIFLMLKLVY